MKVTDRQLTEKCHYDKFYDKYKNLYSALVNIDVVYESSKRPYNPYWKIYDLLKQNDLSGKRILDCGCGAGEHSIRLAAFPLDVYGVDISETAIEIARERAKKQCYKKNITFSLSTLEKLPYEDQYFDFIFGIDILHHVNIQETIPEIKRTLKTNGMAFFKEWREFPLFERIRGSSLGLRLVPKFGEHCEDPIYDCTPTERKLRRTDLAFIQAHFSQFEVFHYYIFARISRLLKKERIKEALMKIDYLLTRYFPVLKQLSGEVVMVLRK